jgi:hypothetical protein
MTDRTHRSDESAHRSAKTGRASISTGRDSASVRSRSREVPEHDIRDLTRLVALDLTPSAFGQCTRPSTPQRAPLEWTGRVRSPEDRVRSVKIVVSLPEKRRIPREDPKPFSTTQTSPPFQMCQHQQVFTTLCMCVSIFTIIFLKELAPH